MCLFGSLFLARRRCWAGRARLLPSPNYRKTDRLLEEQEAARVKQDEVDKLRSELVWRLPIGVQLVWHG